MTAIARELNDSQTGDLWDYVRGDADQIGHGPVRTLDDMSASEIRAIEKRYGPIAWKSWAMRRE